MAVAERILNLQPVADTRPDRALVAAAQRGDPAAASVLVERYYARIYSFVGHLTYGRANVEDLTQEVFARALKALDRFKGEYQFEHWLLRIAKNLCIDEARRRIRSAEPTDPEELTELEDVQAPDYVWESVSRELVATVVHQALAALPPRQRAILVMRELEGMSYADIAQVVGTNPRGVEGTLARARTRFRAEIARVESTEQAQAAGRRTLRLVTENPNATRSPEAANHLATCAECRRRARSGAATPPSRTAFGFLPFLPGLRALFHRPAAHTSAVHRVTGRLRDWAVLAGLGTGAAAAMPLAKMAELAGGVVMVTAVTLAPLAPAVQPAALAPVAGQAPLAGLAAEPQMTSVSAVQVLYRSTPTGQLTVAPSSAIVASPSATLPSIVTPQPASSPGLLDGLGLGLGSGQNPVASTLNSVSGILASQLQQVQQLTGNTLSGLSAGLGPQSDLLPGVVNTVTETVQNTVNGLTKGLITLDGVRSGTP